MSGGSYDYEYFRVEQFADQLLDITKEREMPTHVRLVREKFAEHLVLVAKAMRDIEWVDSSDKSLGDEVEAIMACFNLPVG